MEKEVKVKDLNVKVDIDENSGNVKVLNSDVLKDKTPEELEEIKVELNANLVKSLKDDSAAAKKNNLDAKKAKEEAERQKEQALELEKQYKEKLKELKSKPSGVSLEALTLQETNFKTLKELETAKSKAREDGDYDTLDEIRAAERRAEFAAFEENFSLRDRKAMEREIREKQNAHFEDMCKANGVSPREVANFAEARGMEAGLNALDFFIATNKRADLPSVANGFNFDFGGQPSVESQNSTERGVMPTSEEERTKKILEAKKAKYKQLNN